MEIKNSYNLDFLNNYFTSDEFNFINNANLENEKLNEIIAKEMHNRDIIVNFINNLHNIVSSTDNESNKDFLRLLSDVQGIFEKINDNIKFVQELKDDSSKINDDIVKLLINAEEISSNRENYFEYIQKLKDMINDFSTKSNELKSKVLLNDIKIDTFFQKNIVKKYLSVFDIEFNLRNSEISFNDNNSNNNNDNKYIHNYNNILDNNINQVSTKENDTPSYNSSFNTEDLFEDNDTLLVSEKLKKVFLPYTKHEVSLYLEQYPNSYRSYQDVINKEFVLSLDYYMKHPVVARFREAYSLIRDRESKSVIDAFKFAIDIMFHYSLSPVIIAACKTQEQLEHYLACLNKNKLEEFNDFKIKYEITPLAQ